MLEPIPPSASTQDLHPPKHHLSTSNPYAWPHDTTFTPQTTALLIIDMQRDFCEQGGYLTAQGYSIAPTLSIIPTVRRLLQAFRRAGFPVYHTREGHSANLSTVSSREAFRSQIEGGRGIGSRGPLGRLLIRGEQGHDIIPELEPLRSEPVVDKPGRGAFTHTELDAMLRYRGIRNLVVVGVTTDACVSSTVREASDRGFDCCVVSDGTAAVEEGLKEWALRSIMVEGGLFGCVVKSEEVLEVVESWIGAAD